VVEYREENVVRRTEFPLSGIGGDPAFGALLREHEVETIHTREATLDDVFVAVMGRGLL
jgi:fluoroquinolone transport system ATP-binding protein